MSIITFQNSGQRETGQSLSVSAIAEEKQDNHYLFQQLQH